MPIISKYSNDQVETLVNELLTVLDKQSAGMELSLLAIGNLVTFLINERLPVTQRETIASSFARALQQSVRQERH